MGNVCNNCCTWLCPTKEKHVSKKIVDEENTWFEQDSVPLILARHDDDPDIGYDSVVKKTVVMRSPRTTSVATKTTSIHAYESSSDNHDRPHGSSVSSSRVSPARGLRLVESPQTEQHAVGSLTHSHQIVYTEEKAAHEAHATSPKSKSVTMATKSEATHQHTERTHSHSPRSGLRGEQTERSVSIDTQDSEIITSSRSSSLTYSHHSENEPDDDEGKGERPSSPKSPSKGSKSSSNSGSPKKKSRYGRKNYRANSGRKKNQ